MKKFTFALKWREVLKSYPDDIRREVYEAVIEYAATGEVIEMQPVSRMAFDFIRYELDEKARRREERLAKKTGVKNSSAEESSVVSKDVTGTENGPDLYKITHDYYRSYTPPQPFFINQGAMHASITEDKIRYFVILCAKDLVEAGKTPENTKDFLSDMDYIVSNRIRYIQHLLTQHSPDESLSRRAWHRIIAEARQRFAA
ncbi:MAG: hypothetical protein K2H84_03150 [Paramuribaculum sp.]|nr:hypothetical protein [Paramuribaculum sp.]